MAVRRVPQPKTARKKPKVHKTELPAARFGDGNAIDQSVFKDPEWADQADALVNAIFVRGHPKPIAKAVAADIVCGVKAGKTLAEIGVAVHSKGEDQRLAYRVGIEEGEKILRNRLTTGPRPQQAAARDAIKGVTDDADPGLERWASDLIKDAEAWKRRPRNQAN